MGISGFPARLFRGEPEQLKLVSEHMTSQSFLKIKGREPIQASGVFIPVGRSEVINVRSQPWRTGVEIIVMFPREQDGSDVISLEDKKVQFETEIGTLKVKRKFELKDMVYNGKLEL